MSGTRNHELYGRRKGRNIGLAVVLGAFIVLVFGLTIAKVSRGDRLEGFDHTYRPSIEPSVAPATSTGGNN